MKISTKGRYALRLMLDLAMHDTGEYISIKEIASRQEISIKYLEQIIIMLNRAGFVKSTRGPLGGYRLSKQPGAYTVGAILRLTEGSLAPVSCLQDETNQCTRCNECMTLSVWSKIYDAVNQVIDHITLLDLMEEQQQNQGYDFSI